MNLLQALDTINIQNRQDKETDSGQQSFFVFGGPYRTWNISVIAERGQIVARSYVAKISVQRPMRRLAIFEHLAQINARQLAQYYVDEFGDIEMSVAVPWAEITPEQLQTLIYVLLGSGNREYPGLLGVITGDADLEVLAKNFNANEEQA